MKNWIVCTGVVLVSGLAHAAPVSPADRDEQIERDYVKTMTEIIARDGVFIGSGPILRHATTVRSTPSSQSAAGGWKGMVEAGAVQRDHSRSYPSSSTYPLVKAEDPAKDSCTAYFCLSSALDGVADDEKGAVADRIERSKKANDPSYKITKFGYLSEDERKKSLGQSIDNLSSKAGFVAAFLAMGKNDDDLIPEQKRAPGMLCSVKNAQVLLGKANEVLRKYGRKEVGDAEQRKASELYGVSEKQFGR